MFYRKPPQLLERRVGSVSRARDGGSTSIAFEVGTTTAHAHFPVMFSGDAGLTPGPASLEVGDRTLVLERLAAERSALGGAGLLCLP